MSWKGHSDHLGQYLQFPGGDLKPVELRDLPNVKQLAGNSVNILNQICGHTLLTRHLHFRYIHTHISFFNVLLIFIFSHYTWVTVFCQVPTVQQSEPISHTRSHIYIYIYIYIYSFSFSHIFFQHVPSQVTSIVSYAIQQDHIASPLQMQ